MFQFSYILSEQDYVEFNEYHMFNAPANKKQMRLYRFIIPVVFAFLGFVLARFSRDVPTASYYFYIVFGFVALFWLIFFKKIMIKQMKKNIKRIKKSGKLPYKNNSSVYFEDAFLVEVTENTEAKISYSAIERISITNNAVYIYTSAVQAILMPFRVFSCKEHLDDFLAFIESRRISVQ